MEKRRGLMLLNLGTPDSPTKKDVKTYLEEFLRDPRVIDIPKIAREALLRAVILPRRPKESAEAYEQVWSEKGSPLLAYGKSLVTVVQELVDNETQNSSDKQGAQSKVIVDIAMRYGNPSIPDVLQKFEERGVDELVVFPMYPQYASASTGTGVERVMSTLGKQWNIPSIQIIPSYFDHPAYIESYARLITSTLTDTTDKLILSYHGVPERHCKKSDLSGNHCFQTDTCCDQITRANRYCYRAQCIETTKQLIAKLDIDPDRVVTTFQSRLGRTPWIQPYTDEKLTELANKGFTDICIATPAFVTDCLETLEEIAIRGKEDFETAGGKHLRVVPCLNDSEHWAKAIIDICRTHSKWI